MNAPQANDLEFLKEEPTAVKNNERDCPSCLLKTLHGMPGGRDATCPNCGYKDPCCYD